VDLPGGGAWLHRKGASPADAGLSILPGSRGTRSYVIMPKGDTAASAWSLAHGAGRKWKRREAKDRLSGKYDLESLRQTDLGSLVICEDKDLLYEEAPQAYKNVDQVVRDLVDAGLAEIVAVTAPLITYKVRRED
jgi:release factor H-coupled RctB family protein